MNMNKKIFFLLLMELLESPINSSESEDDEEQITMALINFAPNRQPLQKIENFITDVVHKYTDKQVCYIFRNIWYVTKRLETHYHYISYMF